MSNAQKSALIQSLANFQANAIDDNEQLAGKALPCHVVSVDGAIVTVQFDILPSVATLPQITIPVFGFEYVRYPIQVGDKGMTIPASVSLRGVSGLGTGMADMSRPPSLTALFFMPVANVGWASVDPEVLTMYGPGGVLARTTDGSASVAVEPEVVTVKAKTIRLEAGEIILAGAISQEATEGSSTEASLIGPLTVQKDAIINGISSSGHNHDIEGVQSGGSTKTSTKPNAG
ncbi:phage baseplate protein [Enterobacter ludwigii]|uniref:phage baseplate protein n=1 Tax=Enterobacter TaxID=547 RepID=UPI003BEEBFA7